METKLTDTSSDNAKAIELINPKTDDDWAEITDEIVACLVENEIPDKVVRAAELLICGWPTHKVAKDVGVTSKTVKSWLEKYPPLRKAVALGKEKLVQWRLHKLEQQFILALRKSEDILTLDLEDDTVNSKLTATIAQHSRFIIQTFVGQKTDININVDTTAMRAKTDALDYIAGKLTGDSGPVIDAQAEEVNDSSPFLREDGDPLYGVMGELDKTDDGTLCHACGKRVRSLRNHVQMHKLSATEYATLYLLEESEI